MNGLIVKSIRTKHLLEKYWDGQITGYFRDYIKNCFRKKKAENDAQIAAHLTDEIVPLERETRAMVREWLDPFIAQAKAQDLEIRKEFIYVTKDDKELKSRPHEGYTYTLYLEISNINETDEDRIWVLQVDLLYARLGKASYRWVENKHAKEEIEITLADTLDEISRIGIDAYLKDN